MVLSAIYSQRILLIFGSRGSISKINIKYFNPLAYDSIKKKKFLKIKPTSILLINYFKNLKKENSFFTAPAGSGHLKLH